MALQHLRSSTADKRPTPAAMSDGQLALNTNLASPGLFFKDSNGDSVKIGPVHVGTTAPNVTPGAGGQAGNSKGEAWLDTTAANPILKVWNGSAFVAVQPVGTGTVVSTADTGTVTSTMILDGTILNADINASAAIVDTKLATIATAGKVSNSATTATNANTASAIVARDASGNFSAGTITAALTGNASTVTTNANLTGDVTSVGNATSIASGVIVNADVNASAAIAGTKISPDFGSQTIASTGVFSHALGAAATPSITFTGDLNTGTWSPSADALAASTAGTERLRITSAGLVGIGSSSPNATLTVIGGPLVDGSFFPSGNLLGSFASDVGDAELITFGNTSLTASTFTMAFVPRRGSSIGAQQGWYQKIDSTSAAAGSYTLGTLQRAASGGAPETPRFHITSAGNVGIGVTSPGSALEINAAAATSPFIAKINTAEAARIDSSGRLLVGMSTALGGCKIESLSTDNNHLALIGGNQLAQASFFRSSSSTGAAGVVADGNVIARIECLGNDGSAYRAAARIEAVVDGTPGASDMPGRLVFSTTANGASTPTEAMRINNGQELLVGYTSDNGAYKLQVNSQIFATSATVATSDGRYKENVSTLGDCVDLVKALRPVSFTWKPQEDITRTDEDGNEVLVREGHNFPDGTQFGFIAQEVQEVLSEKPWLTSVIKQNVRPSVNDSSGNELAPEEEFFGIAEGNLIAVLTSALQEAIAKIEALESRLSALEAA